MNRLKKILGKKTAEGMGGMVEKLRDGTVAPLSGEETEYALDFLKKAGDTDPLPLEEYIKTKYLWDAFLYSGSNGKVSKFALELLENTATLPRSINPCFPLRFLLNTLTEQTTVNALLEKALATDNAALRMEAAEYIARTDIQRALSEMIKILPIVGFDHETRDAIGLWLSYEGDENLKAELMEMAKQHRAAGDVENAEWYEWAAAGM
jgi:hypothetical protein